MLNPIQKFYYRTYQKIFRLVIPIMPYRKPELFSSFEELTSSLTKHSIRSLLMITGKTVHITGQTSPLEDLLKKNNIEYIIYDSTVANPTTDNVEEALQLYKTHQCQAIIGFGGGSPIDCAKAVGARVVCPKKSLSQMKGLLKVRKKLPPLYVIPTTAGTGTETTVTSVITDAATRDKYPINDFSLIPHYAILSPEVTRSLPPHLTATTGMDALTHAVEAFIGGSTTQQSRKDALEAVELIFKNLPLAYQDGDNMEARKNMLYASYLAGSAFTVSYVGYVHAIAHSLGGLYNTPHGLANAVLLPIVLEAYGTSAHKKLHQLGICIGVCSENDTPEVGARTFMDALYSLKETLNIPDTIEGIKKEDIPSMATHAAKEANPLYPVPKLMSAKELMSIYYKLL